jgi:hypothetical protein
MEQTGNQIWGIKYPPSGYMSAGETHWDKIDTVPSNLSFEVHGKVRMFETTTPPHHLFQTF